MAQKPEIKIEKPKVFDSKLESGVKKAAQDGADGASSEKFDEKYVIKLTPTLTFDEKAREIVATCTWVIFEGGGSKLFARLKQSKKSTARATVNRDKITQKNLDESIGAVADNEVSAIVKALKSLK